MPQVCKKTKFLHSHEVNFFTGIKAVDCLLNDSPWAKAKVADPDKAELVFETREQCAEYLDELLRHKMFHRARKIPVRFVSEFIEPNLMIERFLLSLFNLT